MISLKISGLLLSLALLAGCATQVVPGMTREEVVARLGAAPAVVPLPAGSRYQYSGQPRGQTAFMVDFDAAGRVTSARQVLNANDFARIGIGQWTRADVEREFGRPASIDRVASWPNDIMAYRWVEEVDKFFWIYLDRNNVVQRTQQGMEHPNILND